MRRERRNPTRRDWAQITTSWLVVRRIPPEKLSRWWDNVAPTASPGMGLAKKLSEEDSKDFSASLDPDEQCSGCGPLAVVREARFAAATASREAAMSGLEGRG